jgi:demethylspheroidene O-methyltransferase
VSLARKSLDTVSMSPGLADRWLAFRNRLIRNPAFQRWAAAFVFTRPVARKRALELFDLVGGFVYSQVLSAVVRLRLLDMVADAPLSLAEIAGRTGLALDPARRLCAAAACLRLLDARAGGRYGLGDLGAALLGNPGVAAMVEHHALFYDDLRDPVGLLRDPSRDTQLSRYWAYARSTAPGDLAPGDVADYSRLMAVSQALVAAEILDAYPVARHRRLMDVGGGEGAFIQAAAARAPDLDFVLFDLPAVAARAAAGFAAAGLAGRVEAVGGDLFRDALPGGADIACLIRVIYDHGRDRALAILRSVRASLPADGVLLVAEPMAAVPGAERVGAAYFGFYLLAMHGGEARSVDDIIALVREAGFSTAKPLRTRSPLFTSLVIARP